MLPEDRPLFPVPVEVMNSLGNAAVVRNVERGSGMEAGHALQEDQWACTDGNSPEDPLGKILTRLMN